MAQKFTDKYMISIVIIVKNDRALEDTLKNIRLVKKPETTEVIVVDSSQGKLDDIKDTFPEVRWIAFIPKLTKPISIPEQRNVGVKAAKGEIIVFIDANCIPKKDWLENITRPIINNEEDIVCGRTTSFGKKTAHDLIYSNYSGLKYLNECSTINLAIRKSVFEKTGYFNEEFDYGSDVEFTWRCADKNFKIRYITNAVISHNWGNTHAEIVRYFRYGKGRANLYMHHPNRFSRIFRDDYYVLVYITFFLLLPIEFFWRYYFLIILIPFFKNWNNKPFTLTINNIIFSLGFLYKVFTYPFDNILGKFLIRV